MGYTQVIIGGMLPKSSKTKNILGKIMEIYI